ncbi:MAG: tyrosine/phenylalanine carboxypeptidase domain-containing protein, partial [Rudaea sp.]
MADAQETLARFSELDRRLTVAVKGIKLLASVSWPMRVQSIFLEKWHAGEPQLPEVTYTRCDFSQTREELETIFLEADAAHPVGDYIRRTAQSWRIATELLDAVGTPNITEHSIRLFGRPGDQLPGGHVSNIDAAKHFIDLANELDKEIVGGEADYCIPAELLRDELQQRISAFFNQHKVVVTIDPNLIAKAAAGPTRIRLRSATCFSEYDKHQLL